MRSIQKVALSVGAAYKILATVFLGYFLIKEVFISEARSYKQWKEGK